MNGGCQHENAAARSETINEVLKTVKPDQSGYRWIDLNRSYPTNATEKRAN